MDVEVPCRWGAEDEGDGIDGQGTGTLPRAIGDGAWRLEGRVLPLDAKEAGVRRFASAVSWSDRSW